MAKKTLIELRVILPDIPDEQDACVVRLEARLGRERGITRGHVVYRQMVLMDHFERVHR